MRNVKGNPIRRLCGSRKNLYILWIFFVLLAKIIRYTILKKSLVDEGIGHSMLEVILNHSVDFSLFSTLWNSDATANATYFFYRINILELSSYAEFEIMITIVWNLLLMHVTGKCVSRYNDLQAVFMVISVLMLNIFDFTLAKEPVQMIFFLSIYYVLTSDKLRDGHKVALTVLCLLLSVITFRSYYVLILVWGTAFAGLHGYLLKKNITAVRLAVAAAAIAATYGILLMLLQSLAPDIYAEMIRVRLRQSSATSDIRTIFGASSIPILSMDYLLVIARLLFPVEVLRFGPKFFLYFISQLIISLVYFQALYRSNSMLLYEKIALYVYSGFLFMSAAFEPDFGSWVRHEAALFPVLVILCDMVPKGRKCYGERRD